MANKEEELFPFKSYSAGHLFVIAKQAYERTKSGKTDQEPGKSDAIVSIVFSAASLEAFINELADMVTAIPETNHPESVQSFAEIMKEIEEARGSIRLKYLITTLVFTGKAYKKNEPPHQDFSLLFKLRDALMHLKPQDEHRITNKGRIVRVMMPKVLEGLQSKNILATFDKNVTANWKSMISTQAVARWACNTTADMVHSILNVLPDSPFKSGAIFGYRDTFQPVK